MSSNPSDPAPPVSVRRTARRRRTGLWVGLGLAFALVVGFCVSIPLVNDAYARGLERALLETPLPERTERVDSLSRAGRFAGAGNGMEYLGAMLVRSDLPLDRLASYYRGAGDERGLRVSVRAASERTDSRFEPGAEFGRDLAAPDLFLVTSTGSGPGGLYEQLDLRGH